MAEEHRELVNDSWLEGGVGCCLEARRDVVHLRDQWPKVEYVDADGVVRTHVFDWHIALENKKRFAIAVKPFDKVESSGLATTIDLIRKQRAHRKFADGIVIFTDRDVTRDDAANAKQVLRSRRFRDNAEVQTAANELRSVNGNILFGDLVRKGCAEASRRNAMWRMIDLGILLPVVREKVTDRTKMWVNHIALKEAFA